MEDTSNEKMFWSYCNVISSVSSIGFDKGESGIPGFISWYWILKLLNTNLDWMFCGKLIESLMMSKPSSLPKKMSPFRVLMPADVLNLLVGKPSSLVQFWKEPLDVLKQTNSLSVVRISSSGLWPGKMQKMLLDMRVEFWV